jgi:hypothetical protein
MTYFFSVIQFVPDPARGEFVNLGAVVGDDDVGDWELRQLSNLTRARAIDDAGLLPTALSFIGEIQERIAEEDEATEADRLSLPGLEQMAIEMNNIVQLTPPSRIAADSAADALDLLFRHTILDPAAKEFRFEKKHRAVRVTRQSYREHGVPDDALKQKADVTSAQFRSKFDFAVHNGAVVQLVGCWSFQLPNQVELADQIKSWAWVVHELRERGGVLSAGGAALEIPADIQVAAVAVPAKEGEESPAFEEARAAFDETDVDLFLPEQADIIGEHAAELLGAPSATA